MTSRTFVLLAAAASSPGAAGVACTFNGGCSWDALNFACTHPALVVDCECCKRCGGGQARSPCDEPTTHLSPAPLLAFVGAALSFAGNHVRAACCPAVPCGADTNVRHYSGVVACGNLFLEQDIGGGAINVAPIVLLPGADANSFYTILMVDPDADVNGSFPDIDAPGAHAPVRHWIQARDEAFHELTYSQFSCCCA